MNKKLLFIAAAVFLFCVVTVFIAYDRLFPMAEPVRVPDMDDIISVAVTEKNDKTVGIEKNDCEELMQYISSSRPTRIMSVNDYPAADTYYRIDISASSRQYWYYVYEDNGQVYVEVPYEGIYIVAPGIVESVTQHLGKGE